MTTLSGTITGIHGITTPAGPGATDAANDDVFGVYCTCTFSGTYAAIAGGAGCGVQLTGVGAAIQTFMHDGRTITPIQACFAAPGDETAVGAIGCGNITVSGTTLTGVSSAGFSLTGTDLVTEHAAQALAVMDLPITIYVTCKAAAVS